MKISESQEHKSLKGLLKTKLAEWFNTTVIDEYYSSGHELDVYTVTYEGIRILVEIVWTPTENRFRRDISLIQADDANIKVLIVNPKIIEKPKLVRDYKKIVIGEQRKGYFLSELIDGRRILDNKNYLNSHVKNVIMSLISKSPPLKNRFLQELSNFDLAGKARLIIKGEDFGKPDLECWKNGFFDYADIKENYDVRRTITDKVIESIKQNFGTLVSGESHVGKSMILKRVIYEMSDRGYCVIILDDSGFDSNSLVGLINRIRGWDTQIRILVVVDNIQKTSAHAIFNAINYYSRLSPEELKFALAGNLLELDKSRSLLEHDKMLEIDYARSKLNLINIEFSIEDAELIVQKLGRLLPNTKIDVPVLARKYYEISRANPLIFFDIIRWAASGHSKEYTHPDLNNDFKIKYRLIERERDLIKPTIYCTFLSMFGIYVIPDILRDCGIHLYELIRLKDEGLLRQDKVFTMHEAWAIEFLLFIFKDECGGDFESFDAKYNVRGMIKSLFSCLPIESLVTLYQRSGEILEFEEYKQLLSPITKEYFVPPHLSERDKVELYTYGVGRLNWLQKNYTEALNYYDKALEIDPHYLAALNDKGLIYYDLGEFKTSLLCYDKGLKHDPTDRNLLYNMGMALQELGQNNEAIEYYDKVTAADSRDGFAWLNKGNAYKDLKQFDQAKSCYDKALSSGNPKAVAYAKINKGSIFYGEGKYDDALKLFNDALNFLPNDVTILYNNARALKEVGKFDEALSYLEKVIALDPANYHALDEKGIIYSELGRNEEALKIFDHAIGINAVDVRLYNNKAQVLKKMDRFEDAINTLNKALEIDPRYAIALINKGNILSLMGNYSQAIQNYTSAITIDESLTVAYTLLGESYFKLKNYKEAIVNFDKGLDIDRLNSTLWTNKGLVELNLENYSNALECFNKALELDPNHVIALTHKGLILSNSGKYNEGITQFEKALRINSQYVHALLNEGKTWVLLKDYDRAISFYSRALSIDPNPLKKETLYELGNVYYNLKKYEKALQRFSEAIKIDNTNASYWYFKGYTLAAMGNEREAKICIDNAVDLDSNLR